jgi:hypothetical protein
MTRYDEIEGKLQSALGGCTCAEGVSHLGDAHLPALSVIRSRVTEALALLAQSSVADARDVPPRAPPSCAYLFCRTSVSVEGEFCREHTEPAYK